MPKKKPSHRLAIYTVLMGEKEALNDPLQMIGHAATSDLAIDYFCLTDVPERTSPTWQMRAYSHPLLPAERASRYPKTQPQRFFPDYEYSLYLDNTVVLRRLPTAADLEGALFRAFRHPWRGSAVDEADVVARNGLDDAGIVARQVDAYARRRADAAPARLTAGTVLLRRHGDARLIRFGELWWEQILAYSKRDQLSLDVCAAEAGCPPEYFPGDKRNNDLFVWPVVAGNARRVQASFDDALYAWQHRHDALAVASPRRHFLAADVPGERFDRHAERFSYACARAHSSLGREDAPRRDLVAPIELALENGSAVPRSILIVAIDSGAAFAADADELLRAEAAFRQYFRFDTVPELVSAAISASELADAAPFRAAASGQRDFGLVVVLGVPAHLHVNVLAKFQPLLAAAGRLIVEFDASVSVGGFSAMLSAAGGQGSLRVFHGRHIESAWAIPSSVALFEAQSHGGA